MDCNYTRRHLLVFNIHAGAVTIAGTVRLLGGDGSHCCAELHNLQVLISSMTAHTFLVLIAIMMYYGTILAIAGITKISDMILHYI